MNCRKLKPEEYSLILESDKKVYPTKNPVQIKTIKKWYSKNPEFGILFEEKGKISGTLIAVPLNAKGWKQLTAGKLSESQLDEKTIFDNSRDSKLGIHIYHIEKYNFKIKEFYKTALKELAKIVESLRLKNKKLKVIGVSGFCVSISGIELFEKKLKCKERKFKSQEFVLEKKSKLFVAERKQELKKKQKQCFRLITRCKMLSLLPKEKSIVWEILQSKCNSF